MEQAILSQHKADVLAKQQKAHETYLWYRSKGFAKHRAVELTAQQVHYTIRTIYTLVKELKEEPQNA